MHTTTHIKTLIDEALKAIEMPKVNFGVEPTTNVQFGDYSSNVAMILFADVKKTGDPKGVVTFSNPRELAQLLVDQLQKRLPATISKIEIAGPGFINFYLDQSYFLSELEYILEQGEKYGVRPKEKAETIYIEYPGPNTNKPLHVGHLRNSITGLSLVGLLTAGGEHVVSTNINNDRGIANIKGMWGYLAAGREITKEQASAPTTVSMQPIDWKATLAEWVQQPSIWIQPEQFKIKSDHWVGVFYIIGDNAYETHESVKETMAEMLLAWESGDEQVRKLWQYMNDWFYEGSGRTLQRLGMGSSLQEYESQLYADGKNIIVAAANGELDGREKGKISQHFKHLDNGAIQAILEPFGLPNKILVRGDGTAIYMTFDIELTRKRTQTYGMDRGIWVVGADQELHFKQLFTICEFLGYGKKEQWRHYGYGMVILPEGKMSSRKGRVVFADDVLEMAVEKAQQAMAESNVAKDISQAERDQIAEKVGIGAVKYAILSYGAQSEIKFDVNSAVSFEGKSGPYIQYTYARCQSVLRKAGIDSDNNSGSKDAEIMAGDLNTEERALARILSLYPEVLQRAANELAPHLLCTYAYEVAQIFNFFYHEHTILNEEKQRAVRLALTQATAIVLKNALGVLTIEMPERM